MLGSSPSVDTDGQPSQQRINFGSVSMPFLDMNSFQPARPNGQSGFESMESMDSALNSAKTTPLNYMRSSVSNRNQQTSEPIHASSKGEQFEDNNLNSFLRTSASAHNESNADLLNTETFGESSDPEPWSETPVSARTSLRQTQLSSDPDLNSFNLDSLNLNTGNYQEDTEPYYTRNSSEGVAHQQVPSRVQHQLQNLQYHQQQQYRQQGNFYGAPGQGNPLAASAQPYVPDHHQHPHQQMSGMSGIATSPRHGNPSPPTLYHSQQQQHQHQVYGAPHQHQYQHQQGLQSKQHQYNHGSYASAPHTPLSVYRPVLQASQQPPTAEEADPLAVGLMSGAPVGAGTGGAGQQRALFPGSQQAGPPGVMAGGPVANQARSPRMGYAQYQQPPLPQQQQMSSGPQGPYAIPGSSMGPPSGMMGMQQELVYQVQFKRNCRAFTLRSRAGFTVNERDFVVVEADRGEDIGIVVEIMSMHAFLERRMNAIRPSSQQGGGVEQEDQNVGCILRLATLHERQQLPDKFHAEKDIVQSCGDLAQHGFGLPITVFEAEFQFDRRKLTIFYDCTVRIDFRDFVRQLYSTYKARIWMKKMSPAVVPDIQPFAAMALATGVQFSSNAL